jgi:hypothetical protein
MRIEWKKKGGKNGKGCKDGKGGEHECCLCGKDRKMDCKDVKWKATPGGKLTSGLESDGYDVHWEDTSCLKKVMGEDKNNPNKVPLRIKIHDEDHLDLIECKKQDDKTCDGGGVTCDVSKKGKACDDWDGHHKPACRRRAGCKSRGLPVPSFVDEEADEEFDDDEFDLDDIEVV